MASPSFFPRFWAFSIAYSFRDKEGNSFIYEKNTLEKAGHFLRLGVGMATNTLFREIRNPIMIIALTALALLGVSIAFYPATALNVIASVCPILLKTKPWMARFALYLLCQSTILGIGLRTLGRLNNDLLVKAWKDGTLEANYPGDRRNI